LNRVRTDLGRQLKTLKKADVRNSPLPGNGPQVAASHETLTGPTEPTESSDTSAGKSDSPKVFLAEAFPTIQSQYHQIRDDLIEAGFDVVPDQHLVHAPDGVEKLVADWLNDSLLFVQLLDAHTYPDIPAFGGSYEGWLLDMAKASAKPILRWCDEAIHLDSLAEARRETLRKDVEVSDLNDFRPRAVQVARQALKDQQLQSSRQLPHGDGWQLFLLHADGSDKELVDRIGTELLAANIGYDAPMDDAVLSTYARGNTYNGVILFCSKCPDEWIRKHVLEYRALFIDMKASTPAGAVYLEPDDREPPQLSVIRPRELETFVGAQL